MDTDSIKPSKLFFNDKINPTEFDITMNALLIGLEAEKYVDVFRYLLLDFLTTRNIFWSKTLVICLFFSLSIYLVFII